MTTVCKLYVTLLGAILFGCLTPLIIKSHILPTTPPLPSPPVIDIIISQKLFGPNFVISWNGFDIALLYSYRKIFRLKQQYDLTAGT